MMMITIGFGSLLSMTECALDTLASIFNIQKKHNTLLRFGTCMFFFLAGMTMTTRGGYYLVNLIDNYTCTIPIIFLATFESIGLGWFYGIRRIEQNIRTMLDVNLNLYWKICIKYVTPSIAIIMLGITFASNGEVKLGEYTYPHWAHIVGYLIVCMCLGPLFFYAFRAMYHAGVIEIVIDLLQPGDNWKPAFDDADNEENSASASSESLTKDADKKRQDNKAAYTSIKLQRLDENTAQVMFCNDASDEEEEVARC
jgi:hypothetical protein